MSNGKSDKRIGLFDFLSNVSISGPKKPEYNVSIGGPEEPPGPGGYEFTHGYRRDTPPPGVGIMPGMPPPPFSSHPVGYRPSDGTHAPPLPLPPHNALSQPPPPLLQSSVPPPIHPPLPHHAPAPPPHMARLPMPPNNKFQPPHPTPPLSHPPPSHAPRGIQSSFDYAHTLDSRAALPIHHHHHRHPPPSGPPPLPPSRFQVPPPLPPDPPLSHRNNSPMPPPPDKSTPPSRIDKMSKSVENSRRHSDNNAKTGISMSSFLHEAVAQGSLKDSTPSPPPLPPSSMSHPPIPSPPSPEDDDDEEEPYDPEYAKFSPASSSGSPPRDVLSEDSLIDKYVRQLPKFQPPEVFSKPVKPPLKNKHESKKKKAEESKSVSPTPTTMKSEFESPARPNLESRLKSIFGRTDMEEEDRRRKKSKKSLSMAGSPDGSSEKEEKPLKETPSPFVSRFMYLYWHSETIKARGEAPVISNANFVDSNSSKTTSSKGVQPQLNGQLPVVKSIPRSFMPPLPKNLPTVPPPNYKSGFAEPMSLKEGSLKAEQIFKNINRIHPYKAGDSKGQVLKSSLDTELEITSEAMPMDTGDKVVSNPDSFSGPKDKTVNLVLTHILAELKDIIRHEITSEILDKKIDQCLEKDKKY